MPNEYNSLGAADAVTAALMDGKSLTDAADVGTDALNRVKANQPCILIMDFKFRSMVESTKSLEDNHLL